MQRQELGTQTGWVAPTQKIDSPPYQAETPHGMPWGTVLRLSYIALGITAFVLLALAAKENKYFAIDLSLARAIQSPDNSVLDSLSRFMTWLGLPPTSNYLAGAVIVGWLLFRRLFAAILQALAGFASVSLYYLVHPMVDRPRPTEDLIRTVGGLGGSSFPSGHVLIFASFYGTLAYLAFTRIKTPWLRIAVLVVAITPIVLVGFTRVYMGQHWPSDVLASYILGSAIIVAIIQLDRWQQAIRSKVARMRQSRSA